MTLKIGKLVHWFHYSHDMIVMDGGVGCIVGLKHYEYGNFDGTIVEVLCDSGEIRDFEPFALDLV